MVFVFVTDVLIIQLYICCLKNGFISILIEMIAVLVRIYLLNAIKKNKWIVLPRVWFVIKSVLAYTTWENTPLIICHDIKHIKIVLTEKIKQKKKIKPHSH